MDFIGGHGACDRLLRCGGGWTREPDNYKTIDKKSNGEPRKGTVSAGAIGDDSDLHLLDASDADWADVSARCSAERQCRDVTAEYLSTTDTI